MKVLKEVIRTGDHTYLDQDGKPQVLRTTPEKIEHYLTSGNAMIAAGLAIPVPLEHQPDAKPMTASELAAKRLLNNAGEISTFRKDIIKDKEGNDVHRLMSVVDFKDDKVAQKVKDGTIRWVSPWINSFVDGKGKEWNEVISHVALTARPRIHEQQPFENIAMAFSQVMPGSKLKKSGFELPSAGRLINGKPEFPVAFSLLTAALSNEAHDETGKFASGGGKKKRKKKVAKRKTADDYERELDESMKKTNEHRDRQAYDSLTIGERSDMHAKGQRLSVDDLDEDEEYEDDDSDADALEEGTPADDAAETEGDPMASAMADDPAMAGNDAGDVSFEELIPHLLEMHGIHVPAGGKGKEFLKALVQGLLTSAKSMAANDGGANDNILGDTAVPDPAVDPTKGPIKQESPPMYMSLEQIKQIKDPEKKQLASALFSLQQEVASVRKNKLDEAKAARDRRIERISKVVSAKNRDRILATAAQAGAALSLTNGVVVDPMATMLDIFEEELQGMPELLKHGKKFSEEQQPSNDGQLTDSEAEKIADQQTRNVRKSA